MRSHLIFPYKWVECVFPSTCSSSAHLDGKPETLNSYPMEWVLELLGCFSLGDDHIFWRNDQQELHNEHGPAVEECEVKEWFFHGAFHRTDGPAVDWGNGQKEWWVHGERHRVDGPAVEHPNGSREWWLNNNRHRVDGPAMENDFGFRNWWLNGESVTEEEHAEQVKALESWSIV